MRILFRHITNYFVKARRTVANWWKTMQVPRPLTSGLVVSAALAIGFINHSVQSITVSASRPDTFVVRDESGSLNTETNFSTKEITERTDKTYGVVYQPTADLWLGEEKTLKYGESGYEIRIYLVNYWRGEAIQRELLSEEVKESVDEVVAVGTRRKIEQLDTSEGTLEYYQTLRMWATSYDGNCLGCTGRTYLGYPVDHGICAVDPKVIKLGSWVYVPGYGKCLAADIGGAVNGKVIDLGFADLSQGWWSSRYVDVYLLN